MADTEMVKCWSCAEEILLGSETCQHCGEFVGLKNKQQNKGIQLFKVKLPKVFLFWVIILIIFLNIFVYFHLYDKRPDLLTDIHFSLSIIGQIGILLFFRIIKFIFGLKISRLAKILIILPLIFFELLFLVYFLFIIYLLMNYLLVLVFIKYG